MRRNEWRWAAVRGSILSSGGRARGGGGWDGWLRDGGKIEGSLRLGRAIEGVVGFAEGFVGVEGLRKVGRSIWDSLLHVCNAATLCNRAPGWVRSNK